MAQFLAVAGGAAVSSSLTLDPAAGRFGVLVASHTQLAVYVDFTTTSGGGSELNWHRLEGAIITSGTPLPAVGIVEHAVSPWMRLHLGTNATATVSACIVPVKG